ncbi:MAG: DUF4129 domain-containing protein [Chloroflexi bacterium]|nr:DUF4129 domain-containing protein [Chloroflexota bacterium]
MIAVLLLMELALTTLVLGLAWISIGASPWPPPLAALLPGPAGLLAGRLVPYRWRRWHWFDPAWWGAVVAVLALLAEGINQVAPGAVSGARWNIAFFIGLALFWRGWVLAEGWIEREGVEAEVQTGLIASLVLLAALQWAWPGAGLLPAVMVVVCGLVTLGLARRAERRSPGARTESEWLLLLGVLVVAVILAAGAAVGGVTPDLLGTMAGQALQTVAALGAAGASFWGWLRGLFPQMSAPSPDGRAPAGGDPMAGLPRSTASWPDLPVPPGWVLEVAIIFFGFVLAGLLVRYLLAKRPRHLSGLFLIGRRQVGAAPISEAPNFSWQSWWRLLLANLLAWLRGPRAAAGEERRRGEDRAAKASPEERSIRGQYRRFLTGLKHVGIVPSPATTPLELAQRLGTVKPALHETVTVLTRLYVDARYGETPPGRREVGAMRASVDKAIALLNQREEIVPEEEPARTRPRYSDEDDEWPRRDRPASWTRW